MPLYSGTSSMKPTQDDEHAKDEEPAEVCGGSLKIKSSIYLHLEEGLGRNPNATAIICMDQKPGYLSKLLQQSATQTLNDGSHTRQTLECLNLTYAELHEAAQRIVAGLGIGGVKPGSTILLLIPNGVEYCLLLWAAIIYRLRIVSLDQSTLRPENHPSFLGHMRMLRPSVLVVPDVKGAIAVDLAVRELRLARPRKIVLRNEHAGECLFTPFEDLAADLSDPRVDIEDILTQARGDDPERIHSVLYTSGTSGASKGCALRVKGQSHLLHSWSWLINKDNSGRVLQQLHNSRAIAPTQMLQTWKVGGAILMPGRNFVVEDTVNAIDKFGATFVVLSPTMIHRLGQELQARLSDTNSVKTVQIGGDFVSQELMMKAAALFPNAQVCAVHGMTEGGAAFEWPFSGVPIADIPFQGEACPVGKVAKGSAIRLWNTSKGCVSRRGEPGEMHISSPSLIPHYLNGKSEDSFYGQEGDRWFNTRDIAVMNDEGLVYILGRAKDVIYRSGVPILPGALEGCIETYTGTQTCVVGIPHKRLGQVPFAVLQRVGDKTVEQIEAHVCAVFGKEYALGGAVELGAIGLRRFPLNNTSKIVRDEVQQAVVASLHGTQAGSNGL